MIAALLTIIMISIIVVLVLLGMCIVGINVFVILKAKPAIYTVEALADSVYNQQNIAVLVLGAGVINNAVPSKVLAYRLIGAYHIYQKTQHCAFIMSGDHHREDYDEVTVMKQYLVEKGIPSAQLYLDHAGYSTYESLYRVKHVLHQDKIVIVTQAYHLSRALLLAHYLGLDAVGVAAPEVISTRFKREWREIFARLKDFAVCYLAFKPAIPVLNLGFDLSKSGDLTNMKSHM